MTYEFTGRRALAIWFKWTLASGIAWFVVHPLGASAQRDLLMLIAGGALASLLHGLVLWSRTLGQDTRMAWLVASLCGWALAAIVVVLLPWGGMTAQAAERTALLVLTGSGLIVGAFQTWAVQGWPRARVWTFVPALALLAGMVMAARVAAGVGANPRWLMFRDPQTSLRVQGLMFGLAYGALSGSFFVWVGRGREPMRFSARRTLRPTAPTR